MTETAVYLYPWDVDGDPEAADRIASLGVPEVSLAAVYHDVRAITPFHPSHRIVSRAAGAHYAPDPRQWEGQSIRPAVTSPGSFERAASALREAGLSVTAWVVVTHNETMAASDPDTGVRNAFGDPYPWALCCANPAVLGYAVTLAAQIASLGCVDRVELEACGWFGFDHMSAAHDKTGGRGGWALDVCLCDWCSAAFARAGVDVPLARAALCSAVDIGAPVPPSIAAPIKAVRGALAGDFLRSTVAAMRAVSPKPVLVQSDADPLACGANPGFAAADLAVGDRAVVNCSGGGAGPVVSMHARGLAQGVACSVLAVAPPGVPPTAHRASLEARVDDLLAAGATGLRFYHAGLARADDLAAIRDVVTSVSAASS